MKLSMIEVVLNNSIQIREVIEELDAAGNVIARTFHRRVVDSTSDLRGEDTLVQEVAVLFPKIPDRELSIGVINPDAPIVPDGVTEEVAFLRIDPANRGVFRQDISVVKTVDGVSTVLERKQPEIVHVLDDHSNLKVKTKMLADKLFTPECRAKCLAMMPRVEVPIKATVQDTIFVDSGKTEKCTRPCKHPEHTKMIDGKMVFIPECDGVEEYDKPVGTEELVWNADGSPKMCEIDTGKTETKIEYKGTLYNEASLSV
jgi:hypothetical protein